MKHRIIFILLAFIILVGCEKEKKENPQLVTANTIVKEIQQAYAPDRRVARFDTEIVEKNNQLIIKGQSTNQQAIADFKDKLTEKGVTFTDSITVLPTGDLQDKTGIINNSVANIRSTKGDASELATQALLGTPVKPLFKKGSWYLVQTPDKYIAWVDGGEIVLKNQAEFTEWLGVPKIIYTESYGKSYSESNSKSVMVSDLVAGDILAVKSEQNNYYEVEYPDGRKAFVAKNESKPYLDWLADLNPSQENLVQTSKQLVGLPYLWGGTSPKGVDCSGFTKTIYFLNGMIIPRDASQQVHEGELIDKEKDYSKLQVGDLLFFGRITPEGKEKVVHVGMWIGNNEYIHSSGRVKINSMDKSAANYDERNDKRYLRSKRYLNSQTKGIQQLKNNKLYIVNTVKE